MRVTINTQPKADEDIFKAGTLVVMSNNPNNILLITDDKPTTDNNFPAIVISSDDYQIGKWDNYWVKCSFVKFIGNVLLEQE